MLREYGRQIHRVLLATDVAVAAAAFVGLVLHPGMHHPGALTQSDQWVIGGVGVIVVLGWPLILARLAVYRSQRRETLGSTVGRLLVANLLGSLILASVAFATDAPLAPIFPILFAAIVFSAQAAIRLPTFSLLHALRRSGRNFRSVLIVGAGPRAADAKNTIENHPEWGLRVVGYLDDGQSDFRAAVPDDQIHKFIDLPNLLRDESIDEVLVACPRMMLDALTPVVRECSMIGVPVTLLTDLFGEELPPPRIGRFDARATLSFAPVHHSEIELAIKRGLDIAIGSTALILGAPVIAVAAAAVRLTSRGPAFFRQTRCGLNGRRFVMWKLRTMQTNAESIKAQLMHLNEMDGPVFKIRDDPRITPVGRFLRTWSIDELPQLWNVVRGDMSLVGPRPPTPDEVVQYRGSQRRRLSMRPGLTCLWQVSGRNEISFDEWMRLDLEYIDNWSLGFDLRLMLKTIPEVLLARGAS